MGIHQRFPEIFIRNPCGWLQGKSSGQFLQLACQRRAEALDLGTRLARPLGGDGGELLVEGISSETAAEGKNPGPAHD